MGLFSSSKKTYVASSVYNMAGPLLDRPSYLKSSVARAVLTGSHKTSLADELNYSMMHGPTFDQRSFYRWAKNSYPEGAIEGNISSKRNLFIEGRALLSGDITVPDDHTLRIRSSFIDSADISYWAERYILANDPDEYSNEWVCDYIDATDELLITYEDTSFVRVTLTDFVGTSEYLVVYYTSTPLIGEADYSGNDGVFLYEMGSGNVLFDALVSPENTYSDFYPVIPLRQYNKSITHPNYNAEYAQWEKAYNRGIGRNLDELIEQIEDNENLGDIDHATLIFGVEINAQQKSSKRYIYEFLKEIAKDQNSGYSDLQGSDESNQEYSNNVVELLAWNAAQSDPDNDLYGTARPDHLTLKTGGRTSLKIKTTADTNIPFNFKISWQTIDETLSVGLSKPDVEKGEFWWEILDDTLSPDILSNYAGDVSLLENVDKSRSHVKLHWQYDDNRYSTLDIYGLVHENLVYKGKSISITLKEGLQDNDDSGFVLPLHYPTLRKLPLLTANELAFNNRILIFNSYQVVVTRWYQKGFFKFLVAIVLAVVFPPAIGVLGASMSVGFALGFAAGTTAALIAGAVANVIAGIILAQIISGAAISLFGEEIGAIVSAVVNFAISAGTFSTSGFSDFSLNLGELMKMDNLMAMTSVLSQSVQGHVAGRMEDISGEMENAGEDYDKESGEIRDLMYDLVGDGNTILNPLDLFTDITESSNKNSSSSMIAMESSDKFIQRTTLTGSDFIEIQIAMIDQFAEVTLSLPNTNR